MCYIVVVKKDFKKNEITKIAKEVLAIASASSDIKGNKATILALSGDLGAGKTTLTQAIGNELGIKEQIVSPTFVLIKFYDLPKNKLISAKKLIHIDAYRFDHGDELLKLGWKNLINNRDNLILIEWPERVSKIIPKNAIEINLSHVDEERRHIRI